MSSTFLVRPIPATTGGTPLVSSGDPLPALLDEGNSRSLEEYFLDDSVVLDKNAFSARLGLPPDVTHIHSSFKTTVACLSDGRILIGEGKPSSIYATPSLCEHGISQRPKKRFHALSAVCSQTDVVVVTASDGLWTFPIEREKEIEGVRFRDDGCIHAQQVCAETCLSLQAGSDFFIALVDGIRRSEERDDERESDDVFDEPEQSPCQHCNDERRLRLSSLMVEADREAEERVVTVPLRKSRPSSLSERRTTLKWNGLEHHGEMDQAGTVRAISMLELSEEAAADDDYDGMSMRAVRGDSPTRGAVRERRVSSSGEDQRDWLGRGEGAEVPIKVSVLTWGANGSGQLGHGDYVQRSQPQPIARFDSARRVCAIAAGNAHAAALTAAGTAFVWGSNVWSNERSTQLTPTLFNTGADSSVLDLTASGEALAVLVVDKDGATSVFLVRGGSIARILGLGRETRTIGVRMMEDQRILMRTTPKESLGVLPAWRESIDLCRLLSNLDELGKHCLQERIKQNSSVSLDAEPVSTKNKKAAPPPQLGTISEAARLIRKLNKMLGRFVSLATVHADRVRSALRADGGRSTVSSPDCPPFSSAFDVLNSPKFRGRFVKFIDAYITARAYGALEELPFTFEPSIRLVEKLSLTYDVSSAKSDSVVRKLFALPLVFLRRSIDEFISITSESSDSGPSGYASEWSHQLAEAAAALETAAATAAWWRRESNASLARTLHKPRRLLVWSGGSWNGAKIEGGLLSVVARSAGILSARYTHVLVFNDIIVFATRNSDQRFPTQLVWMSEKKEESGEKRVLHVDTPDEKFDLEFSSKEERDTFKRRTSFWHWSNFVVESKTPLSLSTSPSSSSAPSSSLVLADPPATRRADRFVFAKTGDVYSGEWRNGVPHGSGCKKSSVCTYDGTFVDGLPHGFGVLSLPEEEPPSNSTGALFYVPREATDGRDADKELAQKKCTVIRGNFERGKARGLCRIDSPSGTVYRGYVEEGVPHGFGEEMRTEEHYIGFFSRGKPHGYGVSSSLNEHGTIRCKYLGVFEEGSMHGEGVFMDGCGAYCEGEFKADQLKSGRLQCPPPEGTKGGGFTIEYKGEFNGWRHALGKGTLDVSPTLRITGRFNYAILGDDGSIKKTEDADILEAKIETRKAGDRVREVFHGEGPRIEHYSEAEDEWSWRPLVDLFLKEELGTERTGKAREGSAGQEIEMDSLRDENDDSVREAWRRVEMAIERRRRRGRSTEERGGEEEHEIDFSHIASAADLRPWCSGYHSMVKNQWKAAIADPAHPLSRFAHTWVQIYQASYGGTMGAHRCVHEKAASELRLILFSVHAILRVLFPNLPANPFDPIPDEEDAETPPTIGSQETLFTVDALSLVETERAGVSSVESETASVRSISSAVSALLPPPPVISFLYDHFFARLHPVLMPLYIVASAEFDDVYWAKILCLNAHTDVKLLQFLGVPECIWPIDLENQQDRNAALICNNARFRFYESAIKMLQVGGR
ncbi:hypothetical protein PMAYCL1PPCAC_28570 [Pristionchus mayeri]|uniref:Uncharacterized protein n=1 Tax=Pristionchus mayeri TaxID=1317129 RepID=A0AAN5DA26_9BILA|nr:hypothetical protein PMAYCL1PPCAC_28570 [Pristionchus mayeri]